MQEQVDVKLCLTPDILKEAILNLEGEFEQLVDEAVTGSTSEPQVGSPPSNAEF
jgi:hypothetical protein